MNRTRNSMKIKATAVVAVLAASVGGCGGTDVAPSPAGTTSAVAAATPTPSASTPADNGVAKLGATEILKKSAAAVAAAKSFHMTGTGVEDDQKMAIDIKVAGKDG